MGSVCFMPNQGCKEGMEILGAWCFIVGAACYMLGDFIEFMKTCALIFVRLKQEEAARCIERAMLCHLFRKRLDSVGKLKPFQRRVLHGRRASSPLPAPHAHSAPSRPRRESLKEVGMVRAFTAALGQQPIIQALQLSLGFDTGSRDIPNLECVGEMERRSRSHKELLPHPSPYSQPSVPSEAHGNYIYSDQFDATVRAQQASELWRGFPKNDQTEFNEARVHMGHIMRK
eukprot:g3032.t1